MTNQELLLGLDILNKSGKYSDLINRLNEDNELRDSLLSSFNSIVELIMYIETGGNIE